MVQKTIPDAEALCLECKEEIFNPICPECLVKNIDIWLEKYPEVKTAVLPAIKKALKQNKYNNLTKCIVCGKKNVFECPYCFSHFVYKILKKATKNRNILKEYLEFFNYDFERAEPYYAREDLVKWEQD